MIARGVVILEKTENKERSTSTYLVQRDVEINHDLEVKDNQSRFGFCNTPPIHTLSIRFHVREKEIKGKDASKTQSEYE